MINHSKMGNIPLALININLIKSAARVGRDLCCRTVDLSPKNRRGGIQFPGDMRCCYTTVSAHS